MGHGSKKMPGALMLPLHGMSDAYPVLLAQYSRRKGNLVCVPIANYPASGVIRFNPCVFVCVCVCARCTINEG